MIIRTVNQNIMEGIQLHHCIFKWSVQNLHLCDRRTNKLIKSPIFKVKDLPAVWHMEFQANNDDKDTRLGLLRDDCEGEEYFVRCKLSCLSGDGDAWFQQEFQQVFEGETGWYCKVRESDEFFRHFEKGFGSWDSQTFTCEILCHNVKASYGKEANPDIKCLDFETKLLSEDMKKCFRNQLLCDVQLKLKGGEINAHKAILCAASPVFDRTFKEDTTKTNIDLPNVEIDLMKVIVPFLYSGDYQDLLKSRFPITDLHECSEQLEMLDLELLFHPQEIYARTEIHAEECEYTWVIKNFKSISQKSSEFIQSPAFTLPVSSTLHLRMRLHVPHNPEDYIGLFIEDMDEHKSTTHPPLQFVLEMSLIDKDEQLCHRKQRFGFLEKLSCAFESFIQQKMLFDKSDSLLYRGTLKVHCDLKVSYGNYGSMLLKTFEMSKPDTYNIRSVSVLSTLFQEGTFNDAILLAKDKKFPVHKFILWARSPLFASMFELREDETGVVDIEDMEPDVLQLFLEYIYLAELSELTCPLAIGLYRTSEKYEISRLKERCSQFLQTNLNLDIACDVLILAHMGSDMELKASAVDLVCRNAELIFTTESGQGLLSRYPNLAREIMEIFVELYRKSSENVQDTPKKAMKQNDLSLHSADMLYRLAERYGLPYLKKKYSQLLQLNLNVDSVCDTLILADSYSDMELKAAALDFVCRSSELVFATEKGLRLVAEYPNLMKEINEGVRRHIIKSETKYP